MKKLKRNDMRYGEVYREIYKIDLANLIKKIMAISETNPLNIENISNKNIYSSCCININGKKYGILLEIKSMFQLLFFEIDEKLKIDNDNITKSLKFQCRIRTVDYCDYILSSLEKEDFENKNEYVKVWEKIKKINIKWEKTYQDLIDDYMEEGTSDASNIMFNDCFIDLEPKLLKEIFSHLEINSSDVSKITTQFKKIQKENKERIKEYISELFSLISEIEVNKKYYFNDADSTLQYFFIKDTEFIGINNISSTEPYFILLKKCDNEYSLISDTFNNLESKKGYKKTKRIDAFSNDENKRIVMSYKNLINKTKMINSDCLTFSIALLLEGALFSLKNKDFY